MIEQLKRPLYDKLTAPCPIYFVGKGSIRKSFSLYKVHGLLLLYHSFSKKQLQSHDGSKNTFFLITFSFPASVFPLFSPES